MAAIGSKNTKPELVVRKALHKAGVRFRLHDKRLPGTPDIVLRSRRVAILVQGCFWHRHLRCKYAYTPKTRTEWWAVKFRHNKKRDKLVQARLVEQGWKVVLVWECETKDAAALQAFAKRIANLPKAPSKRGTAG